MGCFASFIVSLIYPLALLITNGLTQFVPIVPADIRSLGNLIQHIAFIYGGSLIFWIGAFIIGGIPAMIMGSVGGGIIGATFRYVVKQRLSFYYVLQYGFWLSFFFLILRIIVGSGIMNDNVLNIRSPFNDPSSWVVWYIPNLIAFFGFWWVAYKINKKMPTA